MYKILIIAALLAGLVATAVPMSASALTPEAPERCKSSFLGFPAWYDGITNGDCTIIPPSALGGDKNTQMSRYISIIALNIVTIMLMLVMYVSVAFVIFGGFKYLTSAGDSNGISGGKKTVLNAVIGLVLSFTSIAIVNLIASNIK